MRPCACRGAGAATYQGLELQVEVWQACTIIVRLSPRLVMAANQGMLAEATPHHSPITTSSVSRITGGGGGGGVASV